VRAVVQRVTEASVSVNGDVVARIDRLGLLVLVGVTHDDTADLATKLADKIYNLRILDDERSAADIGAPLLVVSQFTLYADTSRGRRPSWNAAAPSDIAQPLVEGVIAALRGRGAHVEAGAFGEHMHVQLINDGPVTLIVEV